MALSVSLSACAGLARVHLDTRQLCGQLRAERGQFDGQLCAGLRGQTRGQVSADGLGRCVGWRFGLSCQAQGMINFSVRFPVREQVRALPVRSPALAGQVSGELDALHREAAERGRGFGHVRVMCNACHDRRRQTMFYEPPHDTGHRPLTGWTSSALRPS